MESRLVRALSDADFFVEPNVAHKDPRTGKSRELDLIAEDAGSLYHPKTRVRTTFLVEAVNNRYPFVLLTERPSTPNADWESYIKYAYSPDTNPFVEKLDIYEMKNANCENLFSQYCVLSKKTAKDVFMASHPDDVYGSLLKLAEYTEDQRADFEVRVSSTSQEYWRLFFWQPMLVVSGQLVAARMTDGRSVELSEVQSARLEFNWHAQEERRTTVIEVVQGESFMERVESIRQQDNSLEARMYAHREATRGA